MARTRHWSVVAPLWLLGVAIAAAASIAILSPIAPAEAAQRDPSAPRYTLLANGAVMTATVATEPAAALQQAEYRPSAPIGPRLLRFALTGGLAVVVVGALVAGNHRRQLTGFIRMAPVSARPLVPVDTPGTEPAHTGARMPHALASTTGPLWPPRPSVYAPSTAARDHHKRAAEADIFERGPAGDAIAACARAVAAAHRYDRDTTRRNFAQALKIVAGVNPGGVSGFWDMPSSGHADLARAYLGLNRRLDARTVLTVALITFRHNRELEALMRDTEPTGGDES